MTFTVFCDGSGTTGGPAGLGYVAYLGDDFHSERSMPLANATNQQAEILAAALALHELPPSPEVVVWSDSRYLVEGVNDWLAGWIGRGWRTASGRPVANRRHWERLMDAMVRHERVWFQWCRGHSDTAGNCRADKLAGAARREALAAPVTPA